MGNKGTKIDHEMDERERGFLDQIFHEMAVRSPDDTISKDTFLNFFDLPGVLGERLFKVFDYKNTGVIDIEEFIDGYYKFARGTTDTKIQMLFTLFDLDGKGGITREELKTVLLSIVTPPTHIIQQHQEQTILEGRQSSLDNSESYLGSPKLNGKNNSINLETINDNENLKIKKNNMSDLNMSSGLLSPRVEEEDPDEAVEQIVRNVEEMVKDAFNECDVDKSGRLDPNEFREWLSQNEEVMRGLEDMFVQFSWVSPKTKARDIDNMYNNEQFSQRYGDTNSIRLSSNFGITLAHEEIPECRKCCIKYVSKRESIPTQKTSNEEEKDEWDYVLLSFAFNETTKNLEFKFCPRCGKELIREESKSRSKLKIDPIASKSNGAREEHHEEAVKVPGGRWGRLKNRFVVLHGKFLYYYKNKQSEFPQRVIFIQGYFIEISREGCTSSTQRCIKGLSPPGSTGKPFILYTNEKSADQWRDKLETAAQTVDIRKHYTFSERLGKGSFAEVYKAVEKSTNRQVAVKAIQKKAIDGKQKEYIRIEMSVMKLVKHPNVVLLEKVFETRNHIYMVMPLYSGGDLYDYMKNNARHGLPEDKARKIIWNVLLALRYLHGLGIVHRDLKPENLLLKKPQEPSDIVITDFGLSKFAAPHEAMKAACGTLSYVAPEVLRMEGYGKEVDLWSCGIILFLVLRAKLPFHDSTKNKIIARILRQKVQLVDPHWQKVSKEAKDLIRKLLIKEPRQRVSVEQAMAHPWFDPIRELHKEKEALENNNSNKSKLKTTITNDIETIEKYESGPSIQVLRQKSLGGDTHTHYDKYMKDD